jgi:Tol biopolymer transport system component
VYGLGCGTVEGYNLYWADITPGSWQISGAPERLSGGSGIQVDPSIASDGRMVFSNMKAVSSIWSIPLDSNQGTAAGEPQRISQDEMAKTQPFVSRDGTRLAYGAFSGAKAMEVRLKDVGSGRETAIAMKAANFLFFPLLSADGSALAYRDNVDNKWLSFLVTGEGAASRQICEDCFIRSFFPNPIDAVVQYDNELIRQNLDSGNRTTILKLSAGTIRDASLSPDGKWLAFQVGKPAGGHAIYIAPVSGRPVPEQEWLLAAEEPAYQQSPDGQKTEICSIFFPNGMDSAASGLSASIHPRRPPSATLSPSITNTNRDSG